MTNQEKIKIKRIAVSFNTALVVMGLKGLQGSYSNLPVNVKSYGELTSAIKRIMNVPVGMKDVSYFTTSFENWQEVLDVIYNIAHRFKWKKERYDCEDRATTIKDLSSLIFGLNTCGIVYCEITNIQTGKRFRHYANLIVDDKGNLLLFDIDNAGVRKKITGQTLTARLWHYRFIKAIF